MHAPQAPASPRPAGSPPSEGYDHRRHSPLNTRHWNTAQLYGSVPGDELTELVDHSWELVVARLPRRDREGLGAG